MRFHVLCTRLSTNYAHMSKCTVLRPRSINRLAKYSWFDKLVQFVICETGFQPEGNAQNNATEQCAEKDIRGRTTRMHTISTLEKNLSSRAADWDFAARLISASRTQTTAEWKPTIVNAEDERSPLSLFESTLQYIRVFVVEMARLGPTRGPGRARAWKSRPAGLTGRNGRNDFYLRFLCALCAGRCVVTRELCIVVTCKCVVYWANVHENETV